MIHLALLVAGLALAARCHAVHAQSPLGTTLPADRLTAQNHQRVRPSTATRVADQRTERLRRLPSEAIEPPRAYVRERWTYPAAGRSDPMQPPAAVASPDAFPDLTLSGIVFDTEHPTRSMALVRVSGRTAGPKAQRHVVQAGDRIDLVRIVRVERARVLVEVPLLGGAQRYYLDHLKSGRSGTPTGLGR